MLANNFFLFLISRIESGLVWCSESGVSFIDLGLILNNYMQKFHEKKKGV